MPGVAWGAFVPALVLSAGIVFPRTCRVVGLNVWDGFRRIVWPAAWPAAASITLLASTRHAIPATLPAVLSHLALGGVVYAALFFLWGLDRDERRWFIGAFRQIAARPRPAPGRRLEPAARSLP
jgi:hypothetical protein